MPDIHDLPALGALPQLPVRAASTFWRRTFASRGSSKKGTAVRICVLFVAHDCEKLDDDEIQDTGKSLARIFCMKLSLPNREIADRLIERDTGTK